MRRWVSREQLYVFGPALVLAVLGFVVAFHFVEPAPPRRVVIATGRADGAYHAFGLAYRERLAESGITLEVRATAGSIENLRLLEDPGSGVGIAFVQGGTGGAAKSGSLVSLASLYFEPLWVFSRASAGDRDLTALRGRRLAIGPDGSGTRAVSEALLRTSGLAEPVTTYSRLTGLDAVRALRRNEVDAVFLVAAPRSATVQEIIRTPGVQLMSFARADAYTRFFPFLTKLVLPEGSLSLDRNLPARDTVLLAPAATLVSRDDFHPALVDLFLATAARIHGGAGVFEQARQFPSPDHLEFPLSDDARRYHASGPPLLARFLPFWAATFADRLKVLLLPLIALLIPLLRIVPPTYRWRVRSRIVRHYRDVLEVDQALALRPGAAEVAALVARLDRIEDEVRQLTVPLSYADAYYHLRLHIDLVRGKAARAPATG